LILDPRFKFAAHYKNVRQHLQLGTKNSLFPFGSEMRCKSLFSLCQSGSILKRNGPIAQVSLIFSLFTPERSARRLLSRDIFTCLLLQLFSLIVAAR
jgi:hypothetical protein